MAKVEGPGIKPNGRYRATELMAQGLYRLTEIEPPEAQEPADTLRVAIERGQVGRLSAHRLPGESLAQQVRRVLDEWLAAQKGG